MFFLAYLFFFSSLVGSMSGLSGDVVARFPQCMSNASSTFIGTCFAFPPQVVITDLWPKSLQNFAWAAVDEVLHLIDGSFCHLPIFCTIEQH